MKVIQTFQFEAAHRLPKVSASHRCYNLHGHSYRVALEITGPVIEDTGFVLDFFDIEEVFKPLLKILDHHYLNDVEGLENPTAENIAIWIWQKVKPNLGDLSLVRVYETDHCWVDYDGK